MLPESEAIEFLQVGGKSKATSRDKTSLSRYFLAWRLGRKILIVLWDAHGKGKQKSIIVHLNSNEMLCINVISS